jgi:hypothetical protein
LDVAKQVEQNGKTAVRALHGAGKTALASWFVHWFALTRDGLTDWKIPTTASVWRQLSKFLWPEIHKWSKRLKWDKIGRKPYEDGIELLTLSLKLETGEAFALASNDPTAIEGAHATSIAFLFDEAKSVGDGVFDAAEGAFSTGEEVIALAISTPGEPVGRFYDICSHKKGYGDWKTFHISLKRAIQAGRVSEEWAEQRKLQWGEQDPRYKNRVLGEFADDSSTGVIPLSWVEAANSRWADWMEGDLGTMKYVGVDVAGATENSDQTVIAPMYEGYKIYYLQKFPQGDPDIATMETANRVQAILLANPGAQAVVDVIGIGTGVADRLHEMGCGVLRFVASQKTSHLDESEEFGFVNKRSAAWWIARELLDPRMETGICLPPDDELTGELICPKWRVQSGAKIKVESKRDMFKRINRSTDSADAVIQALAADVLLELNWEVDVGNLDELIRKERDVKNQQA